jgi:hypothetical protein
MGAACDLSGLLYLVWHPAVRMTNGEHRHAAVTDMSVTQRPLVRITRQGERAARGQQMEWNDTHQGAVKLAVEIAPDAANFREEDFEAAREDLAPYFMVRCGRTIRLTDTPPPLVVFTFLLQVVQAVPANVLANLITGPYATPSKPTSGSQRMLREPSLSTWQ